jgi:hypothetical protein
MFYKKEIQAPFLRSGPFRCVGELGSGSCRVPSGPFCCSREVESRGRVIVNYDIPQFVIPYRVRNQLSWVGS